ncbi:hypothetical protein C882_1244 [Caenispirillum salinarum AK4]|uniref:Uncharacterized protein n=1 Tax=Caenispirillum salinarum AK4 TaxID=1238182 RepID=K9HCI0_9PROT|nr:hypothetical protein C882_1244 [Caenispirillum salinarum AK4]
MRPVVVNGVTLQPGAAVFVRVAAVTAGPQAPGGAAGAGSGPAAGGNAAPAPAAPGAGAQASGRLGAAPPQVPTGAQTSAGGARPAQTPTAQPQTAEPGQRAQAQPAQAGRPGEGPAPARGQPAQAQTQGQAQTQAQASGPRAAPNAAGVAAYGGAKGPLAPQPAPWVSSAAAQPNPASLLQGTVLPGGSADQTLVRTAAGTLSVAGRIAAPPGAQVSLEVLRAAPLPAAPPATAAAAGALGAPTAFSATVWPSMTDALSVLGQMRSPGGADAARQFTAALPRADGQMTASVAAFLGAVKAGGETRAWPGGGVMRALESAGEKGRATARQIGRDLSEAAVTRRDASGAEWRVTTLPFHAGAEVQKIQFITRRQGAGDEDGSAEGEGEGARKGGGQRFLVNLELSRLGLMQIDGLVRKGDRRFDLIIRTHRALSQDMRRDMTGLFANAVSAMGLKGALSFNVTPRFENPVPDPDAPPGRPGLFA